MIDVLVIRLRVEYFLFGDRHNHELMLPRHSLTALVMHGAAVHSMYCLIILALRLELVIAYQVSWDYSSASVTV